MYDTDEHKYINQVTMLKATVEHETADLETVKEVLSQTFDLLEELIREMPKRYDAGQE